MFQENFDKEIASQENAQFSVCQAEKTGAKMAALENQQDIKVQMRTAVVSSNRCYVHKPQVSLVVGELYVYYIIIIFIFYLILRGL